MSFSYLPQTTAIGQVRLILGDSVEATAIFTDEEILTFLSMEIGIIKNACAQALETLASTEAYVQKKMYIMDIRTDGPAVSQELRARAKALREQAIYENRWGIDWGKSTKDFYSWGN